MMVREHRPSPNGRWCLFCGARSVDGKFGDQATCTPRDDGLDAGALRPEPKRRDIACEDSEEIAKRIAELREAEKPRCPRVTSKMLYDCLRESVRCPTACPHYGDWIGSEP